MDHHDQHSGQEVQYVHPHSHWMDNTGYSAQHQSPVSEYHNYAFNAPHVPIEPHYATGSRMNSYPHLQPLAVPPWPSMLANQPHYPANAAAHQSPSHTHPPAIQPSQMPASQSQLAPAAPIVPHASMPRKTLTDADRRRMCIYHEENPTKKQTEIGDLFGVERSTVSKVLRQKEKYLYQDDGSRSPVRRPKGKFPDVERALSNWAKNQEVKGVPLTDEKIREQARIFSTTVGGNDSQFKINSTAWLEKFKQKHGLMGSSRSRKNSEAAADAGEGVFDGLSSPPVSKSSPRIASPTNNGDRMVHSASPFTAQNPFGDSHSNNISVPPLFTPDTADAPGSAFFGNDANVRSRSSSHYISPSPSSQAPTPKFASVNPAAAAAAASSPNSKNRSNSNNKRRMPPPSQPVAAAMRHQSPNSPAISPSTTTATTVSPVTPSSVTMQNHRQFLSTTSPMSGSLSREDARKALEIVMTYFQQQQIYQHQHQHQQQQHPQVHRQGLAISTCSSGGSPMSSSSPTFSSASSATSAAGGGSSSIGEMPLTMDQEEFHAMGKLMNKLRLHQQQLENAAHLQQQYPVVHHAHSFQNQSTSHLKSASFLVNGNQNGATPAALSVGNNSSSSSASLPGGMHRIPQVEFGGGDSGSSP